MSSFHANLNRRRDELGLSVEAVVEELARRGHTFAYSTVAGWFNEFQSTRS